MANEKILQLPPGVVAQPNDALVIARPGANFQLAASQIAGLAPAIDIVLGGNTTGTTSVISNGLLFLAGGNNITLSQNGQAVTVIGGAGGAGGGFSGGVSGGNVVGTTGLTGSQLLFAGGNNVTLSQATSPNGATITISAGSTAQTVQTQNVHNVTLGGNTTGTLAQISSGTLFLAGGNNVTLSQNGNSVTISANTVAAANLSVSAGTTSGAFGGLTFSNGSGVTWAFNNGTINASVSQSVQTQASGNIAGTGFATTTTNGSVIVGTNNTAGNTLAVPPFITTQTVQTQNVVDVTLGGNTSGALALISSGTMFLAGGNNVTLSQNGNSITISANTAAAANISVSAGSTSGAVGGLTFANSNNISWGLNNGTITASSPLQVSGGTTSGNFSGITLSNSNNVSFGLNNGMLTASASQSVQTQNAVDVTLGGNTAGALGLISSGTLFLAGGPNITLSQNGQSVSISANSGGGANFSGGVSNIGNTLGSTGITGSQLVLVGGNNITLSQATGANGATVSISGAVQSNQTLGIYASSNTTGQSSSSAVDARFFTHVGQGIISVGMSGGALLFSASQSAQTIGIYASSQTTGQSLSSTVDGRSLTFVGAGIISVGISQGSVLISAPGSTAFNQSFYATGNTTQSSSGTASIGSLIVQGAGNVSVGISNGSLVISGAGSGGAGGAAISAGTQSQNTGTVSFANSNNVSFGLSAGTFTASVPALSTLSGAGGLSLSTTGSTISVFANPLTRLIWPAAPELTGISAFGNGSISVQYVAPNWPVTASRLDGLVSWSAGSSATANTMAIALSAYAAIYTLNGATLSSLSSGSTQTTYSYASNSAGQTQLLSPAIRPVSVPMNISMTPGEYFVAFNISTNASSVGASTTNIGQTISMMGGNNLQSAANYAEFTAQTATSNGLYAGMGIYTAASAGLAASLALSNIAQTGANLSQANIALVFRNA